MFSGKGIRFAAVGASKEDTPSMVRHTEEETEWDEEGFDRPDGDDEPTVPCPYCHREIHEDSPQCPYCGQYISAEDAPASPKSWLIIVGVLLCLLVVWIWLARGW
jgi:hypothetical protein